MALPQRRSESRRTLIDLRIFLPWQAHLLGRYDSAVCDFRASVWPSEIGDTLAPNSSTVRRRKVALRSVELCRNGTGLRRAEPCIRLGVELGLVFEGGSGELRNSSSRALASFSSAVSKPLGEQVEDRAELLRTPHGLDEPNCHAIWSAIGGATPPRLLRSGGHYPGQTLIVGPFVAALSSGVRGSALNSSVEPGVGSDGIFRNDKPKGLENSSAEEP